ncbi:MAG: M28 family peptidase [Roseitalea sp.]|nr:M28 family peptidase [Roseitalea sp.]MBO6723438.1 M28 family peptidase [Roseitalea sp.]
MKWLQHPNWSIKPGIVFSARFRNCAAAASIGQPSAPRSAFPIRSRKSASVKARRLSFPSNSETSMTLHEHTSDRRNLEWVNAALKRLTVDIHDRCVGSENNQAATTGFETQLEDNGWSTETRRFYAVDRQGGDARLEARDGTAFEVRASPYSPGCTATGRLKAVSTIEGLEKADAVGALLLLHGDVAREPLMPKNFPFFAVEDHQRIIAGLEGSGAAAIITTTAPGSVTAGGAYPAPMIEDGDFNMPSVYMTQKEGECLLRFNGRQLTLNSNCRRIQSKAANIVGRINEGAAKRIVIAAHIDAKKDVPGALDNGTGVATLLLLSSLLTDYAGDFCIELVALNGEDRYAVPGQLARVTANRGGFDTVALNINIDGVGYIDGDTAYSFFNLPDDMKELASARLLGTPGTVEGIQWPQGDHSSLFNQDVQPSP